MSLAASCSTSSDSVLAKCDGFVRRAACAATLRGSAHLRTSSFAQASELRKSHGRSFAKEVSMPSVRVYCSVLSWVTGHEMVATCIDCCSCQVSLW